MCMNILDLYYGLWAQMLPWPVFKRAVLILGIASVIFYIIFMPFFMKILSVVLRLLNGILKGIYCGVIAMAEGGMKKKSQVERVAVLNRISGKAEEISQGIAALSDKAKKKKRISLLKMVLIYGSLILLIGLPDFMSDKIEGRYLPAVSSVSRLYQKLEQGILVKAAYYPPLFRDKEAETMSIPQTTEAEEMSQELWLSLSPKGKDGANMREAASVQSKKVKVLSGDDQVLYLGREGNWARIRLVTGEEGFVSVNLLEGVPEE